MSEKTIVLKGKVKEFIRSYSGNFTFTLEDSQNNLHYCFSTKKSSYLNPSDDLIIFGSYTSGNKVRINYVINQTNNHEVNLVESSNDWTYYLSLVAAIGTTIGFIVALLFSLGVFRIDYGYMGMYGSIFGMIFSIVLAILFLPAMIILWVLTNSFSKKRKRGTELDAEISKLKQSMSIPVTSGSPTKPLEGQMEAADSEMSPQFCAHCGTKVPVGAKFCPSCGSDR